MSTAEVATSPATTTTATTAVVGAYEPRRSNKTTGTKIDADGIVWKERLAVCEAVTDDGNPKLTVRSYFRNQFTHERVWDEPPSGASEIIFATTEQRKKADLQKREMQSTLDELPPDMAAASTSSLQHSNSTGSSSLDDKKKAATAPHKKGVFGRFKKTKERPVLQDDCKDLNLQRAIALSVAEANGKRVAFDTDPVTLHDREAVPRTDEDDVALAKALSISVEQLQPHGMTEDELLREALEASRLDEHRVPPTFDPYATGAAGTAPGAKLRSSTAARQPHEETPQKVGPDEGKEKPGRSTKRRVFGGRKTVANRAGVV